MLQRGALFAQDVTLTIDATTDRNVIPEAVYGVNDLSIPGATVHRHGGNRPTGFSWENNASNAGTDYLNASDSYLGSNAGIGNTRCALRRRLVRRDPFRQREGWRARRTGGERQSHRFGGESLAHAIAQRAAELQPNEWSVDRRREGLPSHLAGAQVQAAASPTFTSSTISDTLPAMSATLYEVQRTASAFSAWQQQYFGNASASAAPTADPDGDGLPNLLEYVSALDPNRWDKSGALMAKIVTTNDTRARCSCSSAAART